MLCSNFLRIPARGPLSSIMHPLFCLKRMDMTQVTILTKKESRSFDSPPQFNADDRTHYFSLANNEIKLVYTMRTPTNKVCFVLQLGYFKSNGKFFTAEQFRQHDIVYIAKMLEISPDEIDLSVYQKKIPSDHRKKILELSQWQPLDLVQEEKINSHVKWLIQRQFSSRQVFFSSIDFCWQNKIELPSCNALAEIITNSYNHFESDLINVLANKLTNCHREKLRNLINADTESTNKKLQRLKITLLKQINQSLRPSDINENVESFKLLKELFFEFKPIIDELTLTDQATEYFSTWVQKSTAFQLNQFANKNKLFLHLLCYIKHQFYYRHDVLVDIFLKSVRSSINVANKKITLAEKENRNERNKAIKQLSASNKDSRELIEKISNIINSPILSGPGKLAEIESLINHYHDQHDISENERLDYLDQVLNKISQNEALFDMIESVSLKLQRRVSSIAKLLEFNTVTSEASLIDAIHHYKVFDGEISNKPPLGFLSIEESNVIYSSERLRISLYKALLFKRMGDAIKSGHLNLLYSYRYKAIHEYLIDDNSWKAQKNALLAGAGLSAFVDFNSAINTLKQQMDNKYQIVNERFLAGNNDYLTIDSQGTVKVTTPKVDSDDSEYVSSLLSKSGFVPILKILTDINSITAFSDSFKHFSIKHKKMKPKPEIIFAGLMGKGCNVGINRIANISKGISENMLRNAVNWCFSLKNIQAANNKIMR